MRSACEWGKSYRVWELRLFRNADLRTEATWEVQRVGEPSVVGRCELPADGLIKFPLKEHYDKVNVDVFNPLLIDDDLMPGAEVPEEARLARAPQDLGAEPEPAQEEPPANPEERGEQEPPGAIGEHLGVEPADGAEAAAENPGSLTALMIPYGPDGRGVEPRSHRYGPNGTTRSASPAHLRH